MKDLIVCAGCKRHVKPSEATCPFCGSGVAPVPRAVAPLRGGAVGGRAALFLAGSALAPGCDLGVSAVPVYGATIDGGLPEEGPSLDAGAHDGGARDAAVIGLPVYGVAIDAGVPPTSPDGAVPPDAGSDASCPRVDRLPVPVYGVAIDAGAPDPCADAGDAQDAATEVDAGTIGVPVYGVPVDR